MVQCRLGDIASVQTGYSFRSAVEYDKAGSVRVIQMRDLGDDHTVQVDRLGCVDMDASPSQQVFVGDVILRSRGDVATSAIVSTDPGRAVVAAPLLRIRVSDPRVAAEYLNWFINQPPAQAYLSKNAEGSNVKMITKRTLEELEVELPPLERQREIVELWGLADRERKLERHLEERRSQFLSEVMMRHAQGGTR